MTRESDEAKAAKERVDRLFRDTIKRALSIPPDEAKAIRDRCAPGSKRPEPRWKRTK